jgi:hypothetical protein
MLPTGTFYSFLSFIFLRDITRNQSPKAKTATLSDWLKLHEARAIEHLSIDGYRM